MSNQILEFSGGAGANKQSYATYYADSQREVGNQPGLARSVFINTVLNQTSKMSVVLAQFIDDWSGDDVLDTDTSADILANFILALEAKIMDVGNDILPIGTVIPWTLETPPTGFLECDGSSLLRATYDNLFDIIGTTYGNADGTHFNLPDYRGKFLRGWAHGQTTDPDRAARTDRGDGTTGDHVGTKQASAMESHSHFIASNETDSSGVAIDNAHAATRIGQGSGEEDYILRKATAAATLGLTSTAGTSTETRPTNVNVMFCIKY